MRILVFLSVVIVVVLIACSSSAPTENEPTPNIDATIEARAKELVAAEAKDKPITTEIATPLPARRPTSGEKGEESDAYPLYLEGIVYNMAGRESQEKDEATKNYQLAIEKFTEAINIFPYKASYYAFRGDNYFRLGQYEEALMDVDRAIQVETENQGGQLLWAHYMSRGHTNIKLGRNQDAVQDLDKAIELSPGDAMMYDFRSTAYRNLGQTVNADTDKAKACSLDSQYCKPTSLIIYDGETEGSLINEAKSILERVWNEEGDGKELKISFTHIPIQIPDSDGLSSFNWEEPNKGTIVIPSEPNDNSNGVVYSLVFGILLLALVDFSDVDHLEYVTSIFNYATDYEDKEIWNDCDSLELRSCIVYYAYSR